MSKILYGERLGKQGKLTLGCSAVLFDDSRQKVLLTRRVDNGLWCLPGGGMEAGESVEECCVREVFEETGLRVRVKRLIGVYSNPNQLVVYPDGNQAHFVVMNFEVEVVGGELGLSDETSETGYFTLTEMQSMPVHDRHAERVADALSGQPQAFIR
ncbi:MAG: NUDIX domain-containing protein [Anaerolineales bacterium]